MLDLYCPRAGLFDGMKILDLGCGWGSLSLYLAEKFPNSKIVGLSNSDSQRVFITEQANLLGLRNLTIVTGNIVDYEFSNEVFDRVLSVEMFEHMRNYRLLLAKIARWLKPSGSLFVHIFAHPTLSYPYEVKDSSDWMTEHFFSGGIMPSEHLLAYFQDDLKISQQWWLNGKHYQKTAEHWLLNTDANAAQIDQIFKQSYGDSFRTWRQRWRMFYMAVSELFGYDNGNQWGVTHILMKKDPRPTAERQGDGRAGG
jgi:cyclopropane-fatty-acyl-phospholipid synthase